MNIEEANAWLDELAALRRPPMTHEELSHWLGIGLAEVPTWKAGACERNIMSCTALARALQPKAEAGEPQAIALTRHDQARIEELRRSRQYWAATSV